MALKTKRTNEVGVVTEYHKVVSVSIDYTNECAAVRAFVHHYATEDYRRKDVYANADNSSFFSIYAQDQLKGDIRELIYNSMKETEEYKDAEDV